MEIDNNDFDTYGDEEDWDPPDPVLPEPHRVSLQVGTNVGNLLRVVPTPTPHRAPVITYNGWPINNHILNFYEEEEEECDDDLSGEWELYPNPDTLEEVEERLMADEFGRCRRPSQPPG